MWYQVVLMHPTGHPLLRKSTESNEVNYLCRLFSSSTAIWGYLRRWFRIRRSFYTKMTWNEVMEPPGHQRSMTSYDSKMIFRFFFAPKSHPWALKKHRIVFYSSRGTRWTLNFCSISSRSQELSAIIGFRYFSALDLTSEVTGWPRTLSLYTNRSVSRRARRSFFPRSSSSIRGETASGVVPTPPPLCRGRMQNGLCRRGLRSFP